MTLEVACTLDGHSAAVNAVRWTQSGEYCLTASEDRTVRLWNPYAYSSSSSSSTTFGTEAGSTGAGAGAPASTSRAANATLVKTYSGVHGYGVKAVCIFGDNTRFASAGDDRNVFLWDVSTGAVVRRIAAHQGATNALAINTKTSTVLATASYDQTVRLWDLRSQSRDPLQALTDFRDSVTSVQLLGGSDSSGSDYLLVAGCVDGRLRTYDLRKGLLHEDILCPTLCWEGTVGGEPIVCSRGAADGTVLSLCLPVPDSQSRKASSSTGYSHSRSSSGGQYDQSQRGQGKLVLSDMRSGKLSRVFHGSVNENIKSECCMLRGGSVACGGEDGCIRVWDLKGGHLQRTLKAQPQPQVQGFNNSSSSSSSHGSGSCSKRCAILSVDAHPTQTALLAAAHDGSVKMWAEKQS